MKHIITLVLVIINIFCIVGQDVTMTVAEPTIMTTQPDEPTLYTVTEPTIVTIIDAPTPQSVAEPTLFAIIGEPSLYRVTEPTTSTKNPTTIATTTMKTSETLKTELDKRVTQIKADISTQASAVVELETVSLRIKDSLKASNNLLDNFKKEMTDFHQSFDTSFEMKVYMDEVDREIASANIAYADILHKLNNIICIDL